MEEIERWSDKDNIDFKYGGDWFETDAKVKAITLTSYGVAEVLGYQAISGMRKHMI